MFGIFVEKKNALDRIAKCPREQLNYVCDERKGKNHRPARIYPFFHSLPMVTTIVVASVLFTRPFCSRIIYAASINHASYLNIAFSF
jgi:hypothetical protein